MTVPAGVVRRPLLLVGVVTAAIGCAMPWFTVGPASQLGTSTTGRWVLLMTLVATVLILLDDRRPGDRFVIVAVSLLLIAAVATLVRAARPPTSMSTSVGPVVCVVGLAVVVAAVAPIRRAWTIGRRVTE